MMFQNGRGEFGIGGEILDSIFVGVRQLRLQMVQSFLFPVFKGSH